MLMLAPTGGDYYYNLFLSLMQAILTQLERICEDCYNLYKDAEVHGYCRFVHYHSFSRL